MEIVQNVHLIPGVTANPYLLIDPDGLTLIDTGIPGSATRILRYLRQLGYSPRDLKRIIVTHADYDHMGSLAALKKSCGAQVYAHPIEAESIRTGYSSRFLKTDHPLLKGFYQAAYYLGRIPPVRVDHDLTEGQVLPILGGLYVIETSGHTPGHISLFAPADRVLFVGDSILVKKHRMVGSHGGITWHQGRADDAVRKQAALAPRIICSGHGEVLMEAAVRFPPRTDHLALLGSAKTTLQGVRTHPFSAGEAAG